MNDNNTNARKAAVHAPCVIYYGKGRNNLLIPAVNCDLKCKDCPWNPAEADRRANNGSWVKRDDGCWQFVFKREEKLNA